MGRAGRFACILVPMLCTLASLIIVILIALAGLNNSSMSTLENFYIFKMDARNLTMPAGNSSITDEVADTLADKALDAIGLGKRADSAEKVDIDDFYTAYLWSHCSGDYDDGKWDAKQCTKPKFLKYNFDIQQIVDDHSDSDDNSIKFPQSIEDLQPSSNALFKAASACYALGGLATAITFVVGWFGLLSRWGSCVTLIFADTAFVLLLAASSLATGLAYSYQKAFSLLDDFGVEVTVGPKLIPATWVMVIFSGTSAFFWLLSTCCCSGRTRKVMDKEGKRSGPLPVQRTPYTYDRVPSPAGPGGQFGDGGVPLQPYGGAPAMEPMRHH